MIQQKQAKLFLYTYIQSRAKRTISGLLNWTVIRNWKYRTCILLRLEKNDERKTTLLTFPHNARIHGLLVWCHHKIGVYISPGNQHCANCIGTLSFPITLQNASDWLSFGVPLRPSQASSFGSFYRWKNGNNMLHTIQSTERALRLGRLINLA